MFLEKINNKCKVIYDYKTFLHSLYMANIFQKKYFFLSSLTSVIIGVLFTASSAYSQVVISNSSANTCTMINNQCVYENKRGGSDPLVVEQLRQETYRNREYASILSTFEIERMNEVQDEEQNIASKNSPLPTIIPYPENFKTIGQIAKEKEEQEKNITTTTLSDEIAKLAKEAETNKCSSQFSDITGNKNKKNIEILECMNIVSGRENGKFFPDAAITRKEAIKISLLVTGKKIKKTSISSVADIDNSDWSVPYIETAKEKKYIYVNIENKLEGDLEVQTDEALALYLSLTKIGVEASVKTEEKMTEIYKDFKKFIKPQKIITDYEIENEIMTRGEFTELSLYILQILRREEEFEPTQQLNGKQYSASQSEPINPENIFPEIFGK